MSHNMYRYVTGSLRPVATTKYISYMNLIVWSYVENITKVVQLEARILYMGSLMVQFWFL